ncbi:class Ib ribonucleoside-diphosphate reductase assembly flavoprotein NrdI [Ureibacillus sp. FSL K6-0786]|uniref:class Ib ribonucleoside-diphosphate reductase assembly flavoprotein NrdI n=1 Tax=Ureibacillus sp. FSL K6-0786 TaxID=2954607 RepID=UPI0030DCC3B9
MIAYASRTGNVRFIVHQLELPHIEIRDDLILNEPFLLFTYTDGLGEVPQIVERFLQHNARFCKGVIASGNSNFGHAYFCRSAHLINERYGIPIVQKIELRGFQKNYDAIIDYYNRVIQKEI